MTSDDEAASSQELELVLEHFPFHYLYSQLKGRTSWLTQLKGMNQGKTVVTLTNVYSSAVGNQLKRGKQSRTRRWEKEWI
jgi:hypothetical protein